VLLGISLEFLGCRISTIFLNLLTSMLWNIKTMHCNFPLLTCTQLFGHQFGIHLSLL